MKPDGTHILTFLPFPNFQQIYVGDESQLFMGSQFPNWLNKDSEELLNWTIKTLTSSSWNEKYFPQTPLTSLQNGSPLEFKPMTQGFFRGSDTALHSDPSGEKRFSYRCVVPKCLQLRSQTQFDCITPKLSSTVRIGGSILILQQLP